MKSSSNPEEILKIFCAESGTLCPYIHHHAVEQPGKFELVIHLDTTMALDLTMPPTPLFQADKVIS